MPIYGGMADVWQCQCCNVTSMGAKKSQSHLDAPASWPKDAAGVTQLWDAGDLHVMPAPNLHVSLAPDLHVMPAPDLHVNPAQCM
mmetsp:Transcript_4153/g.6851  ORF Transcript_4153/g.6851 Transcript_4153/m.6851 type:complete len:85 (-) Transcript_4153:371-625(-)